MSQNGVKEGKIICWEGLSELQEAYCIGMLCKVLLSWHNRRRVAYVIVSLFLEVSGGPLCRIFTIICRTSPRTLLMGQYRTGVRI
jgi:hypothetical protein